MTLADYPDEGESDAPPDADTLERWGYEHEGPEPGVPLAPAPTATPVPVADAGQGRDKPWHTYDSGAIFAAPWQDTPLLCPGLDLGVGRPCGLVGAPGVGKNDTAQAVALAVATGTPAFGLFPVTQGNVIHLTWDMGARPTALRYRRLAAGMGLRVSDLAGRLTLCTPTITLVGDGPGTIAAFRKQLAGYALCIIDNLRAATPGKDENASDFADYVSRLGVAASRENCTVLYMHHSKKGGGAELEDARGSGAILGASGSLWTLARDGEARKLTHVRQHECSEDPQPALWLTREKVPQPASDIDLGSQVAWRIVATRDSPSRAALALQARVLAAVAAAPGCGSVQVRDAVGGKADAVASALAVLAATGKIVDRGPAPGVQNKPRCWHAS